MNIFSFYHVTGESRQEIRHGSSDSVRVSTKIQTVKKYEKTLWHVLVSIISFMLNIDCLLIILILCQYFLSALHELHTPVTITSLRQCTKWGIN